MRKMAKKAVVLLTVLAMLVSMIPGMSALAVVDNSPVVKVVPRALNDDGSAGDVIDPATLQVGDAFVASVEVHNLPADSYFKNAQICICWDDSKVALADSNGALITPSASASVNNTGKKALINVSDELLFNEDEETGWLSTIVEWNKSERGTVPNAINYTATITDSYLYFEDYLYTDVMYPLEDTSVVVYGIRLYVKELGDAQLAVCKDQTTVYAFNTSFSYDAIEPYVPIENAILNFPSTADGWWQVRYNDLAVDRTPIVLGATATEEPTEVPATEVPVTEVPATEVPVTEEPTAVPTAAPALFAEYDLSGVYANGGDGTNAYAAPILTMTKDKAGSNYNNIVWSDSLDGKTDETMTLMFDARVEGYPGYVNTWDGYAISLRNNGGGDTELVRLVPADGGVAITRGAGADVITTLPTTDYVAYSCQYNIAEDTLVVYADGVEVINTTLGFSGTKHGFLIKNGHNDATGTVLKIADMDAWTGAAVRAEATTVDPATEPPTEAPTEAPIDPINNYPVAGEQKWAQDSNTYIQDGEMYIWSDSVKALLTSGELAMISFDVDAAPVSLKLMKGWENGGSREDVVTFDAPGEAIVLFVPNGDTADYYAYLGGVLVDNGSLTFNNADVWNYNVSVAANISDAKVNTVASWLPVNTATEAPEVTEAPAKDYTDMVPVAGTGVDTWKYANNGTENANGGFDLDATNGDQASYIWSDPIVGKINEGKEVMVSFTITVPEDNEVMSAEHGIQFGYMAKDGGGDWGIYTFPEGGTFDCKLGLLPDGQYYFSVDDVQVATGTLAVDYASLWNLCWRTYWAGSTDTQATITNIASAEVAEWVPEAIPEEPTEAPTEAPAPTVTVSNAQKSEDTEGDWNAIYYAITIVANDNVLGALEVSHAPEGKTPVTGSLNLSGISGANIKVAATLAGIPEAQFDTVIDSTFTLNYGDAKTITVEKSASFNTAE